MSMAGSVWTPTELFYGPENISVVFSQLADNYPCALTAYGDVYCAGESILIEISCRVE